MIAARPRPWFARLFARHAQRRITAAFGRVFVRGLDELAAATARGPVLVVANHSAWWDPLVAIWIARHELGADAYAMMDATNLRRLPFFAGVGAFGVDLTDPRDGARAVRYAAKLLDRPKRLVWIFPEGRERSPFDELELLPGAAIIARLASQATLVPVAIRYVFAGEEKPELWVAIGAGEAPRRSIDDGLAQQTALLERERSFIDRAIRDRTSEGFELVHRERPSFFASLAERILARFF